MHGAIPQIPHYAFKLWCSVKAQGRLYLYLYIIIFYFFRSKYSCGVALLENETQNASDNVLYTSDAPDKSEYTNVTGIIPEFLQDLEYGSL